MECQVIVIHDTFQWHPTGNHHQKYIIYQLLLDMRISQVQTHQNHIQPSLSSHHYLNLTIDDEWLTEQ